MVAECTAGIVTSCREHYCLIWTRTRVSCHGSLKACSFALVRAYLNELGRMVTEDDIRAEADRRVRSMRMETYLAIYTYIPLPSSGSDSLFDPIIINPIIVLGRENN